MRCHHREEEQHPPSSGSRRLLGNGVSLDRGGSLNRNRFLLAGGATGLPQHTRAHAKHAGVPFALSKKAAAFETGVETPRARAEEGPGPAHRNSRPRVSHNSDW